MYRRIIRQKILQKQFTRYLSNNKTQNPSTEGSKSQACQPKIPDAAKAVGFSEKVVCTPDGPVGHPCASKNADYKNPEYFCYHKDSFGESMVELEKYRLPAPSAKRK